MNNKQQIAEKQVWALFRELNPDPVFEGFSKSERPDFTKDSHGVELTEFIQNTLCSSEQNDHEWELRYKSFSRKCEVKWREIYNNRPMPLSVCYIPQLGIRGFKNRKKFNHDTQNKLSETFVRFVGKINKISEFYDDSLALIEPHLALYFQGICVYPFRADSSDQIFKKNESWGYPRIAFGVSVDVCINKIIKNKAKSASRYYKSYNRLDLIIYATSETCASTLHPCINNELRPNFIEPSYFNNVWLLDVQKKLLFRVPLRG